MDIVDPKLPKLPREYDDLPVFKIGETVSLSQRWRRPSENAAERLTSTAYRITQAQLEADKKVIGGED